MKDIITTKERFMGLKIHIDSTGEPVVDEALKTVFHDYINRVAPLETSREDVKILLAWASR